MPGRPTPLPGGDPARHARPGAPPRAGPRAPTPAERAARPGDDLPEVPGQRAAAALPDGPRAGRRPGTVSAGRTDPGTAGRPAGAAQPVVPTSPAGARRGPARHLSPRSAGALEGPGVDADRPGDRPGPARPRRVRGSAA